MSTEEASLYEAIESALEATKAELGVSWREGYLFVVNLATRGYLIKPAGTEDILRIAVCEEFVELGEGAAKRVLEWLSDRGWELRKREND